MGMTRRLQHYDVSRLAAMADGGRSRRRRHSRRCRLPDRAARGVDPRPRAAPRRDRAIPGMAARWNGQRRRRRRPGTLPSCPASPTRTPIWARSKRARKAGQSAQRARVRADRNAEEHSDRLRQRLLCRGHRLCPDLAHLVDGRAGPARRIRDVPCLRISRRRRKSRYPQTRLPSSIAITRRRSRHERRRCRR